jgi:hypothetical protein
MDSKKMKLHRISILSIITLVLSSCDLADHSAQPSVPTPNIGIDVQVDKYLEITAPSGWNTFQTDDAIALEIRNVSESQITFTPDLRERIFVLTDKGWMEVKDKLISLNENTITLDPTKNNDPLKARAVIVRPELPDYSVPYDVRIFVVGNLIENGEGSTQVASYIDLRLNP